MAETAAGAAKPASVQGAGEMQVMIQAPRGSVHFAALRTAGMVRQARAEDRVAVHGAKRDDP
eukprot:6993986-Prymnesium_polylepis.1